jgi:hypothetical protein
VLASEEEAMATSTSDGGELGRRTDGGRQGAALSGDEERVPGTREARIRIECERERRKKAGNIFADDVFLAAVKKQRRRQGASVAALVGKGCGPCVV